MAAWAEDSSTGYLGCGGGHLGVGIGHIQAAHKAGLKALVGDVRSFLLGLQVLLGDGDLLLEAPEVEVIGAHLAHQGDEDVPAVFHRGLEVGGGGLEVAPGAPENIQLPGGIQTDLK